MRASSLRFLAASLSFLLAPYWTAEPSAGQQDEPRPPREASAKSPAKVAVEKSPEELEAEFQQMLTGAKLTGQFTMDGKPLNDLQDELYEIHKVQKLKPDGDTWAIHSRIKYGEHDLVLPVPIKVKWAGNTPVLTLDNMFLPGLGTFSARVVLHGNRYAGTWQHDSVGGHLFGNIIPAEPTEPAPSASQP